MLLSFSIAVLAAASTASAALTYELEKAEYPSADQTQAYNLIETAMEAAIARHARLGNASGSFTVQYDPSVETADGGGDTIRFGSNRGFMKERTALHEIAHILGVGLSDGFNQNCEDSNWPTANPLLQSWDGEDSEISCGGGHFWPYGLNYDTEWSETGGDRHVELINAMIRDGM